MMTDERIEIIVANLLRAGVMLAASVVLTGGILYLMHHGNEAANYRQFHGAAEQYRKLRQIPRAAAHLDPRGIIQLGLLLLIATPVARVAFSLAAFAMERDRLYVTVTAMVLVILLYSLFGEH